jgi:cytoskeletal protein RodZ
MTTFGPRLKARREERGLTRAKVAETTGIYIHDIAAVEFEAYDALPPDAEVEDLLRRYGAFLELDVEDLVDSFRRERPERIVPPTPEPEPVETSPQVEPETAPPEEAVEEPPPAVEPEPPAEVGPVAAGRPEGALPVLPVVLGALAVLVVAVLLWSMLRGDGDATEAAARQPTSPAEIETSADAPRTVPEPEAEAEPAESTTPEPLAARPAPPAAPVEHDAGPRIREHGVGTDVVDHRLVGASDRFEAGTQVWFWTRVEDGEPGSRIVHVWIHDGREVERIALRVGSRNWRTQSAKRIYEPGTWTVEARTEDGRVLARDELTAETR